MSTTDQIEEHKRLFQYHVRQYTTLLQAKREREKYLEDFPSTDFTVRFPSEQNQACASFLIHVFLPMLEREPRAMPYITLSHEYLCHFREFLLRKSLHTESDELPCRQVTAAGYWLAVPYRFRVHISPDPDHAGQFIVYHPCIEFPRLRS